MEIVIPPRDHVRTSYKYTYDEEGGVANVARVGTADQRREARRGRQTVQWPFQSVFTEASDIPTSPTTTTYARRATWQPKQVVRSDEDRDSGLIPDYVINYLRGETPETVARRKKNGGKLGERAVDVTHQHRYHQSNAAQLEGFYDEGRSDSPDTHASGDHMLPGDDPEKRQHGARRRGCGGALEGGWRGGVALNIVVAFLIFVVGIAGLIVAATKAPLPGGQPAVFSGTCGDANSLRRGLQAVVSIFGLALLAGANYTFQVLTSPTRAEIARAHHKHTWLDVGVPSLRNVQHISRARAWLALVLLAVAIGTQVIYNGIITYSQTGSAYEIAFVTRSFLTGGQFSNATSTNQGSLSRLDILALQDAASRSLLVNLTTAQCLDEFDGPFDANFKAVLLVTNSDSLTNSLVQTVDSGSSLAQIGQTDPDFQVLLQGPQVLFCLAQPADAPTCAVGLNTALLGAAAGLNAAILICLLVTLFWLRFDPLVTFGDAVASFLIQPDPTTRGACLLTKTDVWQKRWGFREAKYWVPRDHYWLHSPSLPRWVCVVILWLGPVGAAAAGLVVTMRNNNGALTAFGELSAGSTYFLPATMPTTAVLVTAALPQLLLAVLYLAANGLMTTYFLSHESTLYAVGRPLPLRVSASPAGSQFSSLYLTLPRPWSWFLVALFASMAFAVGQSALAVRVVLGDVDTTTTSSSSRTQAIGFSGTGLLVLIALLVVLAAAVAGLGFRRAPPAVLVNGEAVGNPLALAGGSCSAVLSARAHALPAEDGRAAPAATEALWAVATRPLRWGVVHHDTVSNVGHCAYTAGGVAQLDVSTSYA